MKIISCLLLSIFLLAKPEYQEVTKNSYDATAVDYQKNTQKLRPEIKAGLFIGYLSSNSRILDLGCGPGRDAAYFIEKGHQVVGVDISPKMIALARDAVPNGKFIVSDIESLELAAESYDAIWASASLLHVSKQAMPAVLASLFQALKPGGVFYISMKKGDGEEIKADHRFGGVKKFWNYVQEDELAALLKNQGFMILEQETHDKSTSYQTHSWISMICRKSSP